MSSLQPLSQSRLRHKVSEPKSVPEVRAPRVFPLMCSLFPQTYDLCPDHTTILLPQLPEGILAPWSLFSLLGPGVLP